MVIVNTFSFHELGVIYILDHNYVRMCFVLPSSSLHRFFFNILIPSSKCKLLMKKVTCTYGLGLWL